MALTRKIIILRCSLVNHPLLQKTSIIDYNIKTSIMIISISFIFTTIYAFKNFLEIDQSFFYILTFYLTLYLQFLDIYSVP